jgi:glycosyltransferase involved in cell wall biosynthesis
MSVPVVSVIIATRDRPTFLRHALAAATAQSLRDIEVIVSDDAGDVDPTSVVEAFADERVRLVRNPEQLGIAGNVASAMSLARGRYIANLHDDDLWAPTFLERLVAALEAEPGAVVAFCDYDIVDEAGRLDEAATQAQSRLEQRTELAPGRHQPFSRMGIERGSVFLAGAAVFCNGLVDWAEVAEVGVLWDRYTVYLLARDGGAAVYVPDRLAQYRRHLGTETMRSGWRDVEAKLRKAMSGITCAERMLADDRVRESHEWLHGWWSEHQSTKAVALVRKGEIVGAREAAIAGWRARHGARSLAVNVVAHLPRPVASRLATWRFPPKWWSRGRARLAG